jgi:uncharacterized protein YndB with AHSA1/START domain
MRMLLLIGTVVASGNLLAQDSLCNPCVDPRMRPGSGYPSVTPGRNVTAEELRSLGLVRAADMLAQLPNAAPRAESLSAPNPGPPLVHETVVAAPLESVWRAWTTNAGLSAWLAPVVDIDLRIGGTLRAAYDANAGLEGDTAVVNEILAFDPQRMLAFRVAQAPRDFPYADAVASMWTVGDRDTRAPADGSTDRDRPTLGDR